MVPHKKKQRLRIAFIFCPGGGTRTPMLARQILSLICLPISPHPGSYTGFVYLEGANILRFFNSCTKVFEESFFRGFLCYFATLIASNYALMRSLYGFCSPRFLPSQCGINRASAGPDLCGRCSRGCDGQYDAH